MKACSPLSDSGSIPLTSTKGPIDGFSSERVGESPNTRVFDGRAKVSTVAMRGRWTCRDVVASVIRTQKP